MLTSSMVSSEYSEFIIAKIFMLIAVGIAIIIGKFINYIPIELMRDKQYYKKGKT